MLSTCGSLDEARKIAQALVESRLCACTNILPGMESVYRWQGKVERAQECLLLIKTRASLAAQVQEAISGLHSYDTPEVVVLPLNGGLPRYLDWIAAETSDRDTAD